MNIETQKILELLAQFKNHRYVIDKYISSLHQLSVLISSLENNDERVYVTFRGVKYMQMLPYWESAPFVAGADTECNELLETFGVENARKRFKLYYANLNNFRIIVICKNILISETALI